MVHDDICIGRYVRKRLLNVGHILEKGVNATQFRRVFRKKQKRFELKYVGNSVAKTVILESANLVFIEISV